MPMLPPCKRCNERTLGDADENPRRRDASEMQQGDPMQSNTTQQGDRRLSERRTWTAAVGVCATLALGSVACTSEISGGADTDGGIGGSSNGSTQGSDSGTGG